MGLVLVDQRGHRKWHRRARNIRCQANNIEPFSCCAEAPNELYQLIKEFTDKKNSTKKGILSQLKQIKIQGPTDFSVNFDKYSYQQESNDQ